MLSLSREKTNAKVYLAKEAKRRGKLLHMGRVNSDKRLQYAYDLGCDSVDGTGYQRFSKYHLKKALNFMHGLHNQLTFYDIGKEIKADGL